MTAVPPPSVWFLAFNDEYEPIGSLGKIHITTDTFDVADFRSKVAEEIVFFSPTLSPLKFVVWRCQPDAPSLTVTDQEELTSSIKDIITNNKANVVRIQDEIASLKLEETEALLVQVTNKRPKKRSLEKEDEIAIKRRKFIDNQEKDVERVRRALAPSSAAVMPAFLEEQDKTPVLNGRPSGNFGPPVGLFHPVFNSFQAAIKKTDRFSVDPEAYKLVRGLFNAAGKIYEKEKERISEMDEYLSGLLGRNFVFASGVGVESDGAMMEAVDTCQALLVLREVKNEIGTGQADPYNQASYAYRKYWVQSSNDQLRKSCYCPTFLLAFAGPWMCAAGAVYLDKVVIQSLTEFIWLGGNFYDDGRLAFTAQLFSALKASISSLQSYYHGLRSALPIVPSPNGFPFITEYGSKKFTYLDHLDEDRPEKLSYKARLDDERRMVVVKFVSTYHALAHHILAKEQLAPILLYASAEDELMYGGRYMIVMEFVNGSSTSKLSILQLTLVQQAMETLHSHDLVFGDLQRRNILTWDERVSIVDFDWCGQEGEARYPASLNHVPELEWAEGVKPDSIMWKDHD